MIEWLAHHLVTVYVTVCAVVVIGVASSVLLWFAIPAAAAVLASLTAICRNHGKHG